MKANFNCEPRVGNPTTAMKSYQYKEKMSDKKLPSEVTFLNWDTDKLKTGF